MKGGGWMGRPSPEAEAGGAGGEQRPQERGGGLVVRGAGRRSDALKQIGAVGL